MICYCCQGDSLKEIKGLHSQRPIAVCQKCGNTAHIISVEEDKKMMDYYRKEYRAAPDYRNLVTTSHKQFYIQLFLKEFLLKASEEKKRLTCGDVGSATGYIPNFLRHLGHRATGCELTVTFRRFSEHFYGIPLTEELETKHRYDLITIYHVLEHMTEPDKKLAHYVSLLAEGGHIMVSTPEWLDVIEEASGRAFDSFEKLFHKDHINIFSRQSIHNLFSNAGLMIVKEDHVQYGQTYLLRKPVGIEKVEPFTPEKPEEIEKKLLTIKQAADLYVKKQYKEAADLWPRFPDAWCHWILDVHGKEPGEQARLFDECKKHLENNCRMRLTLGIWLYQQQQYEEALRVFNWVMMHRPSEDIAMYMGWCMSLMGKHREAIAFFRKSAEMNPQKWTEAMNWACAETSKILAWDERAMEELKNQLLAQSPQKPVLIDESMSLEQSPGNGHSVVQDTSTEVLAENVEKGAV